MTKPVKKKKANAIRFGQDYFQRRRHDFKPSFLSKSPGERSRLLTQHHRKLKYVKTSLEKTKEWLNIQNNKLKTIYSARRQLKKTKDPAEVVSFKAVEARIKKAKEPFLDLLFGNDKIFTDRYFKQIRDEEAFTSTQHQKQIHNCIRLARDIDRLRKNIAIQTGDKWQRKLN